MTYGKAYLAIFMTWTDFGKAECHPPPPPLCKDICNIDGTSLKTILSTRQFN